MSLAWAGIARLMNLPEDLANSGQVFLACLTVWETTKAKLESRRKK